jgi:hypothetical protein
MSRPQSPKSASESLKQAPLDSKAYIKQVSECDKRQQAATCCHLKCQEACLKERARYFEGTPSGPAACKGKFLERFLVKLKGTSSQCVQKKKKLVREISPHQCNLKYLLNIFSHLDKARTSREG